MMEALLISNVLLWGVVVALAVVVFALVRQIGVLHERVAPAGALMSLAGPKVGERAPVVRAPALAGGTTAIGGIDGEGRSTLLFFLSPTCPVCKTLLPALDSIAKRERGWLRVVLASDGERPEHEAFVSDRGLGQFPYLLSTELGLQYQVAKLPYGVLIDGEGILRAKGLCNSREHIESLFEAQERGVASIQDFVGRSDEKGAA